MSIQVPCVVTETMLAGGSTADRDTLLGLTHFHHLAGYGCSYEG